MSSPFCCHTLHSLTEQYSGTNYESHIYCNHKMLARWDRFFSLSRLANNRSTSNSAAASNSLPPPPAVMMATEGGSESVTAAASLQSSKLPAASGGRGRARAPKNCCKDQEGRRKRRQAKGTCLDNWCAVTEGVCCSFMMCEGKKKRKFFSLHCTCFRRRCVCVPHCLDRLSSRSLENETLVGRRSGPTLCSC